MTELEKIEFLLETLKEQKFTMSLDEMSRFIQSYKWLIDKMQDAKNPVPKKGK